MCSLYRAYGDPCVYITERRGPNRDHAFEHDFFLAVSDVLSPYKSVPDMWLSRGGHIIMYFSMFDALLLKVDVSEKRSKSQHALAWVLVAGHVVVVEAIALFFAERQEEGAAKEDASSPSALHKRSGESNSVDKAATEHAQPPTAF